MEDTVSTIVWDMYNLTGYMHELIHTLQENAFHIGTLREGFPGRFILEGHQIIPILDPISADHVPIAVSWKNQIVTQESLYQNAYLGFQRSIDQGFGLVDRLQVHEGLGSHKATHFVGIMDRITNFVNFIHNAHRNLAG